MIIIAAAASTATIAKTANAYRNQAISFVIVFMNDGSARKA